MSEIESWMELAIARLDEAAFSDGDVIPHDWIRWALGISEPKTIAESQAQQWLLLQRFDVFRDWLLSQRSVALQSIRGRGYWVVPPKEQARFAAEESMRLVQKGLDRGGKLLDHTRLADLDDDAKRRHTDTTIRMAGIRHMLTKQKRDVFALFRPKGKQS